jgi:hypothetical protein
MKPTEIIATEEARQGFYPTPQAVADRLLLGLDPWYISNILEPSAGKGDLVRAFAKKRAVHGKTSAVEVDCVEIDPHLRSILSYEFGGQKHSNLCARDRELDRVRTWDNGYKYPEPGQAEEHQEVCAEKRLLECVDVHIVHDDFLTMDTRKRYDLILMNPPFRNGAAHLLKAIEMQKRGGGKIRCILNAETIRNPYTEQRRLLLRLLSEVGATVDYMEDAFSDAERAAKVDVALVSIDIPEEKHESTIFERLKQAAKLDELEAAEVTDLSVGDFLGRIVAQFNVEIDAGLELIRLYNDLKPHLSSSFSETTFPNLTLCVGDTQGVYRGKPTNVNRFVELTRKKYWEALFTNKEFTGQLTTNLRDKYRAMVGKMQAYDFTLFNIQQVAAEMNAEMGKGIQDTIVALFDKMTYEHHWSRDLPSNRHYFTGWATNKAHKIGMKVIMPVSGSIAENITSKNVHCLRGAESVISDIEKVFEYLDGNMTAHVDLHGVLEAAFRSGKNKGIRCKFFTVTLYKKGTMHITFHDQRLVDRFNIYCCSKKNWLPPNYGRTTYSDMSAEARAVVDEFNGNGTEGSGAAAYAGIMERQGYFLAEPGGGVLALPGA